MAGLDPGPGPKPRPWPRPWVRFPRPVPFPIGFGAIFISAVANIIGWIDKVGAIAYLSSPHTYFGWTPLCIVTEIHGC